MNIAKPYDGDDASATTLRVPTSRWGVIEVLATDVIHLADGLLGLDGGEAFVLIRPSDDATFFWLQSVEQPSLATVVTDPTWFFSEYRVELREEMRRDLQVDDSPEAAEAVQTLVIVNKATLPDGDWLTANLTGPLLINPATRRGRQVVIGERKWDMRQRLVPLAEAKQRKTA